MWIRPLLSLNTVWISRASRTAAGEGEFTGGIYGSHFLYMIQAATMKNKADAGQNVRHAGDTLFDQHNEQQHLLWLCFATMDTLDPWFFSPPDMHDPIYMLSFPGQLPSMPTPLTNGVWWFPKTSKHL